MLLIGSGTLPSAQDVFSMALHAVLNRLQQIPYGETGSRGVFIAWQRSTFLIGFVQSL